MIDTLRNDMVHFPKLSRMSIDRGGQTVYEGGSFWCSLGARIVYKRCHKLSISDAIRSSYARLLAHRQKRRRAATIPRGTKR